MGYVLTFVLGFSLNILNDYRFAATFAAFSNQTVPVAVAQLSGQTPLYVNVLSYLSGPLFGTALWAGTHWANLRRL